MPETYEHSLGDNSGAIDADALNKYVERAARVMVDQKALGEDLKEICAEADEAGVATKSSIRQRARESLMDPEVLRAKLDAAAEQRAALGWFKSLPVGAEPTFLDRDSAKPRRRGRPSKNGAEQPRDLA